MCFSCLRPQLPDYEPNDVILDAAKLGQKKYIRGTLIPLIRNTLSGWEDITKESHIDIERVSGALTNFVFFITKKLQNGNLQKVQKVVLRIYGNGVDQLFDREKELRCLEMLSIVEFGPQLLSTFSNGRFEQFLDSTTLNSDEIHFPEVSRQIAYRLRSLHNIVNIFPPKKDTIPEVWINVDKWFPLIDKISYEQQIKLNLKDLDNEIRELKSMLSKLDSPIVFAHNDTQYGNILRLDDGSNQLVVVDFEYSGYNYRGFDLANHFCDHVMWGLWGIIQSFQSDIDFDYFAYGAERLQMFRDSKDKIYNSINNHFHDQVHE
ncbi:7280_t:CDS:2 [Diversispora eburnea]|uniref:7280_t:CDS:1 n=1 Tax=Diversispora eburnea TaxID=1213867 RepID=A0A9N8VA16_9GLOM|nr:7280_t:CDS:2 [Diversispora eburnea]